MAQVECPACKTRLTTPPNVTIDTFQARCVCGTVFTVAKGVVVVTGVPIKPVPAVLAPKQIPPRTTPAPQPAPSAAAPAPAPVVGKVITPPAKVEKRKRTKPTQEYGSSISFTVNGQMQNVANVDPSMSLNAYLRTVNFNTDVKKMCEEGGCGACAVMLAYPDPATGTLVNASVNSCLRPLASVDGCAITTAAGIGSAQTGYHPVQERLADNNGSQCGACSPGMVVAMYSLLANNDAPTSQQIENQFDGNLCRCTGYRPILQSMQTFACDAPAQEAAHAQRVADGKAKPAHCTGTCSTCKGCEHDKKKSDIEEICVNKGTPFDRSQHIKQVKLPDGPRRSLKLETDEYTWYTPTTLPEVFTLLANNDAADTRVLVGNTSTGIYKNPPQTVLINLKEIPDLNQVQVTSSGLSFGAAVSINTVLNTLIANEAMSESYTALIRHIQLVANQHVRNIGCWAGNLMISFNNADFPSDLFTIFMAAGVNVTVCTANSLTNMSLDQLLNTDMTGAILTNLLIPVSQPNDNFDTFKVMLRHENSHAYVNAGFLFNVDPSTNTITSQPSIVYGGVGPYAQRASNTEAQLVGANITDVSAFSSALATLQAEMIPDETPGYVAYRTTLVASLFYKYWLSLQPSGSLPTSLQSAAEPYVRPISDGVENYQSNPAVYPLNAPIPSITARAQAAGQAPYADDFMPGRRSFCAAFVTSTIASGVLESFDISAAQQAPGFVAFYSAKDIPAGGVNNFAGFDQIEEFFASSTISYYGQSIGLVVCDTQAHADAAAQMVTASYSNVQAPILTIQDAMNAGTVYPAPGYTPVISGDVNTAFQSCDQVISGQVMTQSTYHFTMQTQTTVAVPNINGQLLIHSESQNINITQLRIAGALNMNASDVIVDVGHCGGGYGAKIDRGNVVACAVALAANILGAEVRCQLNLNTNMMMVGKRHPQMGVYKCGFNNDGMLQAIELTYYVDGGFLPGLGTLVAQRSAFGCDNGYNVPNWNVQANICFTNTPCNTAMRGPGDGPGRLITEHIIEHVATTLNMDPYAIRMMNMYVQGDVTPYKQPLPYFTLPEVWSQLVASSDYNNRVNAIAAYNASNTWTKRGISMVPCMYGLGWSGSMYGVLVNVVAGDGSVQVQHSGIEIGQGINTKIAQVVASELGCPMDVISVHSASTSVLPNANPTGGSTTSELNAAAAVTACQTLLSAINVVRNMSPGLTWAELVMKCAMLDVPLSAMAWNTPTSPNMYQYMSYAAGVVEVQVDLLTGVPEILRADINFDCGQSMNPAIDMGQVEGAFVMGLGQMFQEALLFDTDTGALTSNGTWEYKPPCSKDIPVDFRVTLLRNAPNPLGVLSSKASGEPPICLAAAAFFAAKHCISEARAANGTTGYFELDAPATIDVIQQLSLTNPATFNLTGQMPNVSKQASRPRTI